AVVAQGFAEQVRAGGAVGGRHRIIVGCRGCWHTEPVPGTGRPPPEGLRVLDVATLFAGPVAATMLGDFGADVVKVEHPRGDPLRTHGAMKGGHGLLWKVLSRNKWTVTIDLSVAAGQELLAGLARQADVVIENFRPGVMERWGLG